MMKPQYFLFALCALTGLAGCSKETPEPSMTTCAPAALDEVLAEIRSEPERHAFVTACQSLATDERRRTWDYAPSPMDDF